jgi:hypothetical protein
MENIWSESYKSLREPFFEIEDPYTNLTEEKCNKCGKSSCECEDNKYGEKEEKKYKKSGKKSKDYDGDGEVEDESDEYAGVKDRAIKKAMKEGYSASKKIKSNEKIDVKSGIQNKINTSPTIPEEFCAWVDSLLEEGYDLSDYTWDEMYDIYEAEGSYGATPKAYSAASTTKMTAKRKPFLKKMLSRTNPANRTSTYDSPRKGMSDEDRERARAGSKHGVGTSQEHDYPSEGPGGVTKSAKKLRKQKAMGEFGEEYEIDEMVDSNASKSSLAQKKIRKEKADLELAKEMQKSPNLNNESVINYLNSRYHQI